MGAGWRRRPRGVRDRGGLAGIEDSHLTANATPNNPNLPAGVPEMAFATARNMPLMRSPMMNISSPYAGAPTSAAIVRWTASRMARMPFSLAISWMASNRPSRRLR